jgi:phosphoenolpyruvate synthase/pyruvate phosphate dikinase
MEDGAHLSFAGMFASLPFQLVDDSAFARAMIAVWLSAVKKHVLDYIALSAPLTDLTELVGCMNIALQPMIEADVSGVLFSRTAPGGQTARVLANYGAGEMLNSLNIHQTELQEEGGYFAVAAVTTLRRALRLHPEQFLEPGKLLTDRDIRSVVSLHCKSHLSFVRLTDSMIARPCLSAQHRVLLFEAMTRLIQLRGDRDFEIEFVIQDGQLYIVQIRQLTALDEISASDSNLRYVVGSTMSGPVSTWATGQPITRGDILAVDSLSYSLVAVLGKAGGILTTVGSAHSHAAIICREIGVPVALIDTSTLQAIRQRPFRMVNGTLVS